MLSYLSILELTILKHMVSPHLSLFLFPFLFLFLFLLSSSFFVELSALPLHSKKEFHDGLCFHHKGRQTFQPVTSYPITLSVHSISIPDWAESWLSIVQSASFQRQFKSRLKDASLNCICPTYTSSGLIAQFYQNSIWQICISYLAFNSTLSLIYTGLGQSLALTFFLISDSYDIEGKKKKTYQRLSFIYSI